MERRKGNTVSATGWIEAMEKVWCNPVARQRIKLNRGDIGFGQEKVIAWHEQPGSGRPNCLFKLKLTKNVKRAIQKIYWPDWQGHPTEGMQQLAELELQLTGWSRPRRVVVSRTLKPINAGPQEDFWSIFVRVIKNQQGHTEAITSRYELLMIPGRLVTSGRQRTLRLSVDTKLGKLLKAVYSRLWEWLSQTAPQLVLNNAPSPPWLLFDPRAHPA